MSLVEKLREAIAGFQDVKVRDWSHLYFVLERVDNLLKAAEEPAVYKVTTLGLSQEELAEIRQQAGPVILDYTNDKKEDIVWAAVAYVTVGSEPGLSDDQVAAESVRRQLRLERSVKRWLGD